MRTRVRPGFILVVALLGLTMVMSTGQAAAFVADASAFFSGPVSDPIPAGTSVVAGAQFSLGSDAGPIVVSVELQNTDGMGTVSFDPANTSAALLSCDDASGVLVGCDWDGASAASPQTLSFAVSVDEAAPPGVWTLAAFVESASDTDPPQELSRVDVVISAPVGSTTLSGQVITLDGAAVPAACIFVLAPAQVFGTVADGDGRWTLGNLPDASSFAVAAVTPFEGAFGPCANDGPPPIPGPSALQPEFFDDVWIDLSDPDLVGGSGDPYTYAIDHGATTITGSRAGIVSCLTATSRDVVPRPPCFPPPTTTPPTTIPPSTSLALPGVNPPTLAVTGPHSGGGIVTVALALIALGAGTIAGARRREPAHWHSSAGR